MVKALTRQHVNPGASVMQGRATHLWAAEPLMTAGGNRLLTPFY